MASPEREEFEIGIRIAFPDWLVRRNELLTIYIFDNHISAFIVIDLRLTLEVFCRFM